jgi:hypothetical protein
MLNATRCDHNLLFKCQHPNRIGLKCIGPCNLMVVNGKDEPHDSCFIPVELGKDINSHE